MICLQNLSFFHLATRLENRNKELTQAIVPISEEQKLPTIANEFHPEIILRALIC